MRELNLDRTGLRSFRRNLKMSCAISTGVRQVTHSLTIMHCDKKGWSYHLTTRHISFECLKHSHKQVFYWIHIQLNSSYKFTNALTFSSPISYLADSVFSDDLSLISNPKSFRKSKFWCVHYWDTHQGWLFKSPENFWDEFTLSLCFVQISDHKRDFREPGQQYLCSGIRYAGPKSDSWFRTARVIQSNLAWSSYQAWEAQLCHSAWVGWRNGSYEPWASGTHLLLW